MILKFISQENHLRVINTCWLVNEKGVGNQVRKALSFLSSSSVVYFLLLEDHHFGQNRPFYMQKLLFQQHARKLMCYKFHMTHLLVRRLMNAESPLRVI